MSKKGHSDLGDYVRGGLYPVTYMGTPLKKIQLTHCSHIFSFSEFCFVGQLFSSASLGSWRPCRSELPVFSEPHKPPAALPLGEAAGQRTTDTGQNATDWTSDIILTRHINHREIDEITRRSWNGKHSIIVQTGCTTQDDGGAKRRETYCAARN